MSKRRFGATASISSVGGQTFREAPIVLRRQTRTTMATITGVRMTHGSSVERCPSPQSARGNSYGQWPCTYDCSVPTMMDTSNSVTRACFGISFISIRGSTVIGTGATTSSVTDDGNLLHEIEWSGRGAVAHWLIEASDIEFTWQPKGHATSGA